MIAELLSAAAYYLVTVLIGLVTGLVIYARWNYGTLEKIRGLKAVIKPAFVGGSDFFFYRRVVHQTDSDNVKKYWKVFGVYEGREPQIFIADPELIRLILIKDFSHFHDRRMLDFGHELIYEMLDILPYDKWKLLRNFISPSLTTGKIRNMSVPMVEAIEDWISIVKSKLEKNQAFETKKIFSALTADVIARCIFATKANALDDPNSPFLTHLKGFVMDEFDADYLAGASQTLPFLSKLSPFFDPETLHFYRDVIKNAMHSRRQNKVKVNDFVDCLNDLMEKVDNDPEYKRLGITETTVMSQALVFFFAGFETTASTLSFLTYNLAKNPGVQSKLLKEVDAYLGRHSGKIEHDTIGELTYMAACIQETLRMFPPIIRIERVCTQDWVHEPTGLHIPKGMPVLIPKLYIHYNEEYFPEPYTFKPERFLAENKDKLNPYTFLSFGHGNHNCVGMRFAREEMYLTMANVLKHFEFRENSESKIKFKAGRNFLVSTDPFSVDAIRRQ